MMDRSDSQFDSAVASAFQGRESGPADVRAFHPPAVDPTLLSLTNRLSRRQPPVAVALGDAALAFTPVGLGSAYAIAPPAERVVFWFLIDGRPLVLQMTRSLYERILARVDPELLAADIDRNILPLLLESCVEDGLTVAEARLQGRVELAAIEAGAAYDLKGLDLALEISIDGEVAGPAALRASREDVERLATLLAARPKPPRSYGDLSVELRFRAGAIWLDLGALRTLKRGDVLLVEEEAARWERMAAVAGEHWLFPIEVTRAGPTVKAPFRRADQRDQEEWMMVDHNQADDEDALSNVLKDKPKATAGRTPDPAPTAAPNGDEAPGAEVDSDAGPASPPADAAFDDLPIKLVFELGRVEMPLGQLQDIGPGHVFQLDRPLGEAVEIHAGNRRIGQGEIVRIEDQIGVRIVRLFGQNGA
ncbi:MAG: type III secretion system cytoplasmic ring protein SctQ [Geminicoccaceae bacterium]